MLLFPSLFTEEPGCATSKNPGSNVDRVNSGNPGNRIALIHHSHHHLEYLSVLVWIVFAFPVSALLRSKFHVSDISLDGTSETFVLIDTVNEG